MARNRFTPFVLDPVAYRNSLSVTDRAFLDLIGHVDGQRILDMGCGNGFLSIYMARQGACVTAIDSAVQAVHNTKQMACVNGLDSGLKVCHMDARTLGDLGGSYDLVVGRFILHHIEPFPAFVDLLSRFLGAGRGVFLENSARNPILMFCRSYLVGKFGIPKLSNAEEFPFEQREIEILQRRFRSVKVYSPEFLFFNLMSTYFSHPNWFGHVFKGLDTGLARCFPFLRQYSYCQIIEFRHTLGQKA